jgi:hypothetical protein
MPLPRRRIEPKAYSANSTDLTADYAIANPPYEPRGDHAEVLRFNALRNVSSIRDCQPSPVDLKYSITSGLRRSDTNFFVEDLFGPRPLRSEVARSGKAFANGLARAKSVFVSSGLSLTSRRSFLL